MKRISDELFVTGENRTYSLDDVIAIRIQNDEFYFLGWMENAECYSIQWAKSNPKIERDLLIASDDIFLYVTKWSIILYKKETKAYCTAEISFSFVNVLYLYNLLCYHQVIQNG